jgi:hypothetical protein
MQGHIVSEGGEKIIGARVCVSLCMASAYMRAFLTGMIATSRATVEGTPGAGPRLDLGLLGRLDHDICII